MLFRILAGMFLALAVTSVQALGFESCSQHFFQGKAPKLISVLPSKHRPLCFDSFAVLHSGESKTPVYVAEHLTYAQLSQEHEERTDRFYEEARLPAAERARLADYAGSGFDRGHLAPAGEMMTANAMAQSFSLANMVPQAPQHNRGIWAKSVESATRHYVMRTKGDVYVLTGPIYEGIPRAGATALPECLKADRKKEDVVVTATCTIGAGKVWAPTKLFKLVYDPARQKAWAHVVPNRDDARMGKPISYEELVKLTGIQLLNGI